MVLGIGVGVPLMDFIFATSTICISMAIGVVFCCCYIKKTSRRAAEAEARRVTARVKLKTEVPRTRTVCTDGKLPNTVNYENSVIFHNHCCTIYVPEVGIISV